MTAGAQRVAIGKKAPWIVKKDNTVHKYENDRWVQDAVISAKDIGIGAEGSVYAITSVSTTRKGYALKYLHPNGTWMDLRDPQFATPLYPALVNVDIYGKCWFIDEANRIFSQDGYYWIQ
jgi:hypothetical protein